ncbi:MAG: methionine biosynthesis protein MetW [Chloroflexi bacterium]|nr:methionine biosynthesis protein MetW [Chloroflexota bacterium]
MAVNDDVRKQAVNGATPAVNGTGRRRIDYDVILNIVERKSRVLDLGCGSGDLLSLLIKTNQVIGYGMELEEEKVYDCIARGLSVHHGDIDDGLRDYPDHSFDYVILSLTLQAVRKPQFVIEEMLRVGTRAIVSFPNFAYLPIRLQLGLNGRMPVTSDLPYNWYDSPNIHHTTVKDFWSFCDESSIKVRDAHYFGSRGRVKTLPNLRAHSALFVLE